MNSLLILLASRLLSCRHCYLLGSCFYQSNNQKDLALDQEESQKFLVKKDHVEEEQIKDQKTMLTTTKLILQEITKLPIRKISAAVDLQNSTMTRQSNATKSSSNLESINVLHHFYNQLILFH